MATEILTKLGCLHKGVRGVVLYCDCCGGQNRNKYIASLLIYVINYMDFDSVAIKLLESGHTQMEADSIHSTIESSNKKARIYSPDE